MKNKYEIISTVNGFDIVNEHGDTVHSYDRDAFFELLVSQTDVSAALDRVLNNNETE